LIKTCRELTGLDLKTSKEYCEEKFPGVRCGNRFPFED